MHVVSRRLPAAAPALPHSLVLHDAVVARGHLRGRSEEVGGALKNTGILITGVVPIGGGTQDTDFTQGFTIRIFKDFSDFDRVRFC